jgi:hypothetical protein
MLDVIVVAFAIDDAVAIQKDGGIVHKSIHCSANILLAIHLQFV